MTSRVHPAIPFHLTLVLAEPGEESKRKPPVKAPGGTCIEPPRISRGLPHWLSFGTAGREGTCIPATLSRALCRLRLVYPLASLDVSGQWPISCADASPNEGLVPRIIYSAFKSLSRVFLGGGDSLSIDANSCKTKWRLSAKEYPMDDV